MITAAAKAARVAAARAGIPGSGRPTELAALLNCARAAQSGVLRRSRAAQTPAKLRMAAVYANVFFIPDIPDFTVLLFQSDQDMNGKLQHPFLTN